MPTSRRKPQWVQNEASLSKRSLVKIKKIIDELGNKLPNPHKTKLKGKISSHKIRPGNYCIIYEIHDDRLVVMVVKIGHRKDVYENLPKS